MRCVTTSSVWTQLTTLPELIQIIGYVISDISKCAPPAKQCTNVRRAHVQSHSIIYNNAKSLSDIITHGNKKMLKYIDVFDFALISLGAILRPLLRLRFGFWCGAGFVFGQPLYQFLPPQAFFILTITCPRTHVPRQIALIDVSQGHQGSGVHLAGI